MRADEYVVNELLKEKQKNEQLIVANSVLRNDCFQIKNKLDLVRSLFRVDKTSTNGGYVIQVVDTDGTYAGSISYVWTQDPEKIPLPFLTLLDALGLQLPSADSEEPKEEPQANVVEETKEEK